jgi:hypothetical protein
VRTARVGADHFTMGQMERNGVLTECSDMAIHDRESNTLIAQFLLLKMVSKSESIMMCMGLSLVETCHTL